MTEKRIEISEPEDIATAREAGHEVARNLGLAPDMETCLTWAIREIARQILQFSRRGACVILDQSDQEHVLVQVMSDEQGPGITLSVRR